MGRPQKEGHGDTWSINVLLTRVKSKEETSRLVHAAKQPSTGHKPTNLTATEKPFLSTASPIIHFLEPEFSKAGIQ